MGGQLYSAHKHLVILLRFYYRQAIPVTKRDGAIYQISCIFEDAIMQSCKRADSNTGSFGKGS